MATFLDAPLKSRVMLLYGSGLQDCFIGHDLVLRDFNTHLLMMLKEKGYPYVIFYDVSGNSGAYCLDEESARFFFGAAKGNARTQQASAGSNAAPKRGGLASAAMGRNRKGGGYKPGDSASAKPSAPEQAAQQPAEQEKLVFCKQNMEFNMFLSRVNDPYMKWTEGEVRERAQQQGCAEVKQYRLAVVFDSLFISDFSGMKQMEFNLLQGWNQDRYCKNICLIKAPNVSEGDTSSIVERLRELQLKSQFLIQTAGSGQETLNPNRCFCVGLPGTDEIGNLLNRLALLGADGTDRRAKIDHAHFRQLCREAYTVLRHERETRHKDQVQAGCDAPVSLFSLQESKQILEDYMTVQKEQTVELDANSIREACGLERIDQEKTALEELNRPGWESVYEHIERMIERRRNSRMHARRTAEAAQLPLDELTAQHPEPEYATERLQKDVSAPRNQASIPHFMLLGNPGTGKTTVARLIGRLLKEMGILESGHTVEVVQGELTTSYVGEIPRRTLSFVERASEGVLFIDEAHSLGRDDTGGGNENSASTGQQVLSTLVAAITRQHIGTRFCLILAGYENQMMEVFKKEPGLRRRMGDNIIVIKDYEPEVLLKVLTNLLQKDGFTIDRELLEPDPESSPLSCMVQRIYDQRGKDFGNAGDMVNLAEAARENGFDPVIRKENFIGYQLGTGRVIDEKWFEPIQVRQEGESILAELDKLIGLKAVKAQVGSMMAIQIRNQNLRAKMEENEAGSSAALANASVGMHSLFLGNPGTGKTTVARLMGRYYHQLGFLSKGHVVETDRSGLVGRYVGETAQKTLAKLEEAMGGVLFIDEAYALSSSDSGNDFGQEAIDTIVKFMEDHRDDLMVIAAGYSKEMRSFIAANSGLASRFTNELVFEDYNGDELMEIFRRMAASSYYKLDEGCEETLIKCFRWLHENKGANFGNGRTVRNVYERMVALQAYRIGEGDCTLDSMLTFTAADIPSEDEWAGYCGR